MKWFVILLLLSFNSFSEEICEEDKLTSFAKKLSLPNCFNTTNIDALALKENKELCNKCKPQFETLYNEKINENIPELQKDFLESSLNEYKKNLTNNLLSSAKLKTLFNTQGSFEKAISACKMKTNQDLLSGCKSEAAKKLLENNKFFEKLSHELSNDLAKFLSRNEDFNPRETLLSRNETQCFIPERDILFFSTLSIEEALDKDLISLIQKLDPKKFDSVNDIFNSDDIIENYDGDIASLKQNLFNHPLIAPHLKSSEKFVSFIKKISAPGNLDNLRKALYSPENAKSFDQNLADSCEKSFKTLKENICSDEFQKGRLYNDYAGNFSKLSLSKTLPDKQEVASTQELINNNLKLLATCENKDEKGKRHLSKVNTDVGVSLTPIESSRPLEAYRGEKYNNEIGNLTNTLCKLTDDTCVEGTITCSIFKKYQESKKPGTLHSKLASSSNTEVDALLLSMIGSPKNLDPKTKEILVLNGILPKDDGTLVAQAEIPERQSQVYTQQDKTPTQSSPVVASLDKSLKKLAPSAPAQGQASTPSEYSSSASSTDSAVDNLSEVFKENNNELKEIQDEIRRRLQDMPKNRPVTKDETKKIVNNVTKSKGRNLSPSQTEALTERIMNERPSANATPTSFNDQLGGSELNQASVSNSETQLSKWKKAQMNAALADMQGARRIATKDIIDAKTDSATKPLTTVALSIAEDPRITLSDVFNDKISRNDSETQLLKVLVRNQKNFILQVKSVNFKVIFDEKKELRILLESGDKKEAERLRPQLEMFLKKLKSNTPLRY